MIPLYCIVDRKPIPEERLRRGAKTCDKECQRLFRRAFLLDRKERYRKAAGLPPSQKSTGGQRNSVPEPVYAADPTASEIVEHPGRFSSACSRLKLSKISLEQTGVRGSIAAPVGLQSKSIQ